MRRMAPRKISAKAPVGLPTRSPNTSRRLKKKLKKSKNYISCFLFLVSCCLYSQTPQKIKFSKSSSMIYFFQAGEKQDTIIKNKSDLFYLWVPDTLKEIIVINVDNGQFQQTDTDTL